MELQWEMSHLTVAGGTATGRVPKGGREGERDYLCMIAEHYGT